MIQIDGQGLQPHLEAFMWEVLEAMMNNLCHCPGRYDRRVFDLVKAAFSDEVYFDEDGTAYSGAQVGPQNNLRAIWHTFEDEFEWDVGPEVQ